MATEPDRTYPSELPVLALRQTVVFPLTLQPLAINRPMSIETVNHALAGDRLIFLALQTNDKDEPEAGDLHAIGTVAAIRQMAKVQNGGVHVIVRYRDSDTTEKRVRLHPEGDWTMTGKARAQNALAEALEMWRSSAPATIAPAVADAAASA